MFEPFPGEYGLSQAVNLAMRSGLQAGEAVRATGRLSQSKRSPTQAEWFTAWSRYADHEIDLAQDEEDAGYLIAAGERYLRASVGLYVGQLRISPRDVRAECLAYHWEIFRKGMALSRLGYEYVTVDGPDGPMLGWFLPGSTDGSPTPAVVFYPGFDLDKEMIVLTLRDSFRRRGVGVLVLDGPGIGETLWARGISCRPDFEVPTRAAMTYLRGRSDVDGDRLGVAGISLGGYYATRAAAYEPELRCCVAWGALKNFGVQAERRRRLSPPTEVDDWDAQLMAVMGTDDFAAAIRKARTLDLEGNLSGLMQPFLLLHGEADRQIPLEEAKWVFRHVPSADKEFRVYTLGEGGAEHCQVDEPIAARELVSDWVSLKLKAELR